MQIIVVQYCGNQKLTNIFQIMHKVYDVGYNVIEQAMHIFLNLAYTGSVENSKNATVGVHKVHDKGICMQIPGSIYSLINTTTYIALLHALKKD